MLPEMERPQVQSEIRSHGHRKLQNLLSRETTFLMGILKKCLSVEKAQNEPNNQISSLPVSGHSVPPTEADPLTSTEGVFSHSVPSTEGVFLPFSFRPRKQLQIHLRPWKTDLR